MNQEKIGNLIKEIRKEYNLTQKQLADKLGVTFQAVSKWENGKNIPDIAIIKKISEIFNVDINSLLNGENKQQTRKNSTKNIMLVVSIFLLLISFVIIFFNKKEEDYNFKIISTSCKDFKISGSIAYNQSKSTIYISRVEYCGGEDNNIYKYISAGLYEQNGDISKLINKYEDKNNITLSDYLEDLNFHIDNYKSTCRSFNHSSIYIELTATKEDGETIIHKIPLKMDKTCQID